MKRLVMASLALAAACAPTEDANGDGIVDGVRSPDSVSQIAPSNPVGTVSGIVVSTQFAGLEGVQVTMVLGGGPEGSAVYRTNTNSEGAFSFRDVPGGSQGQLTFAKSGYSPARVNVAVPAGTSNIPINDGNGNVGLIALTQLTSTIKVRVLTARGAPARGAQGVLEVVSSAFQVTSSGYGGAIGNFTALGTVDDNGLLTFTGAPDIVELLRIVPTSSVYQVSVSALDEDMDGRVDSWGTFAAFTPRDLYAIPDRLLLMPDARNANAIAIAATSLESLTQPGTVSAPYRNMVKGSEPITIAFNQAIAQTDMLRTVVVTEEDCETIVPVSVTNRAANILAIAPTTGWVLGKRYNLSVRVTGLESGTTNDFIGYFFAIDPAVPRALSAAPRFQVRKISSNTGNGFEFGDTLYVTFDLPITRQAGQAIVQVNADLNQDGMIGGPNGFGEFGGPATSGFAISPAEILIALDPLDSPFTCRTTNYTSRWTFSLPSLPASGILTASTPLRVVFPADQLASDTYQTAWGQPVVLPAAMSTSNLTVL